VQVELPTVGVGELGEGAALAGLGPSQDRIGHRVIPSAPWTPSLPVATPSEQQIHRSISPGPGVSTQVGPTSIRRLTMTLVTTPSDPVEIRRKIPFPPYPRGSLRPVSAAVIASEPPVRRWRAFSLLVVAYFMTIVDLTIVNVSLPTI